jgi:hypothetical protein
MTDLSILEGSTIERIGFAPDEDGNNCPIFACKKDDTLFQVSFVAGHIYVNQLEDGARVTPSVDSRLVVIRRDRLRCDNLSRRARTLEGQGEHDGD